MNILRYISNRLSIRQQIKRQSIYNVQFYNCWDQANDEMYWNQFIQAKHLLDKSKKKVAVFSVFGPKRAIEWVDADIKIFYSAENLDRFPSYLGYCLDETSVDLAMGFDYVEGPRYIRFPLWMDYMFPADSTVSDIYRICEEIRHPKVSIRNKFCCMVASNSADGLRDEMLDRVSEIAHVDSAGRHRHNDDSLLTEYGDNKCKYLRNYQFNICPENTSTKGYVSEKLFESMREGCIPIYWGGGGQSEFIEPEVVNQEAFIYWNRETDGINAIKQIKELYRNKHLLKEFLEQPRLLPTAEGYILDTYSKIETKLREIINTK